jgi:O-antigen ligase
MIASVSRPAGPSRGRSRLGASGGLDLLVVPFLGLTLLVRVLTDNASPSDSRHSGTLNLSGDIALLFILLAAGLLLRRRKGVAPAIAATLWLCVWTAVALHTRSVTTETLREGLREGSVVALAVIIYNARGAVSVPIAARLVQLIGVVPALLALYQLATNTGMVVAAHIRSNGTFAHPNSAAMFFAIAAMASMWLYLDNGRRRYDILLSALFAAALLATFSIDGLIALSAMLVSYGALHPGPPRVKLVPFATAGLVVLVFFVSPLGSERIATESATSLRGEPNTSLAWRVRKWKTLLPEWERSPIIGRGLGITTTFQAKSVVQSTLAQARREYLRIALPHNEYVRYLVETGVAGLAIALGALAMLMRALLRKRWAPHAPETALNSAALAIATMIGCLVDALADNTFLNSPTCYATALIVAAVLALPRVEMHHAPQTT